MAETITLSPIARRFIEHWGEMGSRWGVNRTVSQIHGLLYYVGRPMHAEEIADVLAVARSNVSMSLRELHNWNLIRQTRLIGDRRDYFETSRDVWELFRIVVRERRAREFDPTVTLLREIISEAGFKTEDRGAQMRVRETLALMDALSDWSDQMLRLERETVMKVAKLGGKIRKLVGES